MKNAEFNRLFGPIVQECHTDGDMVFAVHVGKKEQKQWVMMSKIDTGDALVIIKELVGRFQIHPKVLVSMLEGAGDQTKTTVQRIADLHKLRDKTWRKAKDLLNNATNYERQFNDEEELWWARYNADIDKYDEQIAELTNEN